MRSMTISQTLAVTLAVLGLCLPQVALAAAPQAAPTSVVTDVRMHESGTLLGQVVSPENLPVPGVKVALLSKGKQLAVGGTDKSGYFAFKGLQNGVYQMVSPKGNAVYRVWSHQTAPPSAHLGALVVNGDDTVRGQHRFHGFRNWMANPWFVAAVITAAVAIPVAIHNSDNDNNSSPGTP